MPDDCLITLRIKPETQDPDSGFLFHIDVDGQPVATNQTLAPEEAHQVREVAKAFGDLFEHGLQVAPESLDELGAGLFDLWLGPSWPKIEDKLPPGCRRWLVVASASPEILNLPWELLRAPGEGAIGADNKWTIRRLPWGDEQLAKFAGTLRAPPLRLLFMACSPRGLPELDYEREEEYLLGAIASIGQRAVYDSGDLGTYDELRQKIDAFEPHIVHLSGHGAVQDDGLGHFAFEGEGGEKDLRSSKEIGQLFAGSNVQCAFISGCQTGKAPDRAALGGVCQGLVREGVPMAIGWAASIADDVANQLARTFYETVAAGAPVDRALSQGRLAVQPMCAKRKDASWALPVLYTGTRQERLFDPQRPEERPPRPSLVLKALPGMTEGYAEHFIGRRREQQRLLPALRDGSLQGVVLTGLGGAGKSTLTTRIARKLEAEGFTVIAISSSTENPLDPARLIEACAGAFLDAGLERDEGILRNAERPPRARLHYIVTVLNRSRFVLVLDNFESNLDEQTRKVLNADLADFVTHLAGHLSGDSRVLITSRHPPADMEPLPAAWRAETLGEFPEASFIKYLLRDPEVEQRYYQRELPRPLLARLHRLLGGTPRFLEQIRNVLRDIETIDLEQELDAVALPEGENESRLRELRDQYCERIFTSRLYGAFDEGSRRMLSRAAVFDVPVPVEGFAAAAGTPVEQVRKAVEDWRRAALAHPEADRGAGALWTVYGTLRGWLTAEERLPADERHAAEEAAGDYLVEMEKADREGELGLAWVDCLLEARALYLAADAVAKARDATDRISGFLVTRGLYPELERLNQELMAWEEHPQPLRWIGRSHLDRGDYGAARTFYERASEAAGEADQYSKAVALHQLATIDLNEGDYPGAREKFGRALSMRQEIGDRAGEAATWHQLATIDLNEGDYTAAREKFERSLSIKQKIGDRAGEAATWHNLASIDLEEGDYPAAGEKFGRSLSIFQEIGDRAGEAATWHNLASIDLEEGDYPAAREKFGQSLSMRQEIGDRAGEAATWHQLATIDVHEGDYPAAREKFGRALSIMQEIGDRAGEAATWHNLATIDLEEGDHPAAREKFGQSLSMRQEIGDRAGEARTWHQLGFIAWRQDRRAEGMKLVALSFAILQSIGHADAQTAMKTLAGMAGQLDYTSERVQALLEQVVASYQADRGRTLYREAFGEELPTAGA